MRFRAGLRRFKRPPLLGIENGDVGVAAAGERASATQVNYASRTCGEEFDDSCERNFVVAMQSRDGEAERGFESR